MPLAELSERTDPVALLSCDVGTEFAAPAYPAIPTSDAAPTANTMSEQQPTPRPSSVRALPGWLAIVLVAGTSASVLVLEILAGRLLAPYVGVSLDTYTGIIGTILAGIAVGAWAGGALADRIDPRRLLIPLLLMLGGVLGDHDDSGRANARGRRVGSGGGTVDPDPGRVRFPAVGHRAERRAAGGDQAAAAQPRRDRQHGRSAVGVEHGGAIVGTFFTGFVLVAAASE